MLKINKKKTITETVNECFFFNPAILDFKLIYSFSSMLEIVMFSGYYIPTSEQICNKLPILHRCKTDVDMKYKSLGMLKKKKT